MEVKGIKLITAAVENVEGDGLMGLGDSLKEKAGSGVILIASAQADGKVNLLAMATDDAVEKGAHAGNLIKELAPMVGGGGGGRPSMARAGGKDAGGIPAMLEAAKVNENRAVEMERAGSISKAECSQFTAERAQDEYNVVQAESQERNYKRQLKALLQITDAEPFDVVAPIATDEMALQPIPSQQSVYEVALENRPEMRSAQLAVEAADIQARVAKAGRMPSVSLQGAVGTNTSTLSSNGWADQMKTNFNAAAGLTVSVPIYDQRSTRTAINKAAIARQEALLGIRDRQTTLYSTIENYWIQATNNQAQYRAAKVSTEAAQASYDLLSEQFSVGLKNIVELQEGKTRLISAMQNELQSKYMTILNIKMLELYKK